MKLRTRLDVFSAALLSALGASQVVACGGTALSNDGGGGASAGHGGAGTAGSGTAGSGTAGAGIGGASMGGAGGAGNKYPCQNPKDLGNGLISCDGFTHRAKSETCKTSVPRPDPYPSTSPNAQCKSDADCTAKPYGWCGPGGQLPGPLCEYGCVKDSDCGANQLCQCGDPVGACVSATCQSDADCAAGFLCKGYDASGGCGLTTFTCQSSADTCGADAECVAAQGPNHGCQFDATAMHFSCRPTGCAIGRPFLIDGEPRLAPTSIRSDWSEPSFFSGGALDAQLAADLRNAWTRVALMEHASIAAFARFSLQLLSLGAPPELVERATAAMADETKHARACFAVVSAYAGEPVGPGSLAIADSLNGTSLEDIVLNTIREGCIGETVAAIEAREAAEYAADPALKQLLFVISEDETRHAELAFRFVKWALTQGDARLAAAVRREFRAFEAEADHAPAAALSAAHAQMLAHGVVPEALRRVIRARALRSVVSPCSRALFATDLHPEQSTVVSTPVLAIQQSTCSV